MSRTYTWVGRTVPRRDAFEKAAGRPKYSSDFFPAGLLWVTTLRSNHVHARICRIDAAKALAHRGVIAVLTHRDVPPPNRYGVFAKDRPVLCDDTVRCVGDPVALVAADSPEAAQQAVQLIDVDYEPLPAVTDPLEALRADSPRVHGGGNICRQAHLAFGDVEAAFRQADVIVENTYTTGPQIHAYLETEAGISYLDEGGRITIVAGGQSPYRDRHEVCQAMALPEDSVRIIIPHVGGAFGGKDEVSVQLHLALVTLKTRRPARLVWTREESNIAGVKRHPAIITMKTAVARDGTLLANKTELVYDTGAYASLGPAVLDVAMENCNGPYRVSNVDVRATAVYTNNAVASAFRGFGAPQVCFAIESQLDIIAMRLGIDPIQLRLRNALRRGDVGSFRNRFEGSVGITACLQSATRTDLWVHKAEYKAAAAKPWLRRGVGVAAAIKGYTLGALPDKGSVGIELTTAGKFRLKFSSTEIGQGVIVALSQVAAETLRCGMDDIEPTFGDTSLTPDTSVTSASRQLYLAGNAVIDGGRKMLRQMAEAVHLMAGEPVQALEFADAYVLSGESGRHFPYVQVATFMHERRMDREIVGEFEVPRAEPIAGTLEIPHLFYMFAVVLALVEVNVLTGFTRVLRLVSIPDVGKAVNPQAVEGQVEGAAVQGMGYALMEESKIDRGVLKTVDLATYLIPSIKDAPEIEVIPVEQGEDTGPFGAKGVGEIGIIPVAPAVANAIHDAVAVRATSLPITPEKLYWSLKQQRPQEAAPPSPSH